MKQGRLGGGVEKGKNVQLPTAPAHKKEMVLRVEMLAVMWRHDCEKKRWFVIRNGRKGELE